MNINKFTIKSQEALQHSQQVAQRMGHQQIENEHLMLSLIEVDENVLPYLLGKLNVNLQLFTRVLQSSLESFPKVTGGELQFSR